MENLEIHYREKDRGEGRGVLVTGDLSLSGHKRNKDGVGPSY